MDIHEYQAKALLKEYGVPIPFGGLAYSPEQAAYRAKEIGGDRWVVKAQVHTGARGKAGGIRVCSDEHQVWDAADELLGHRLVTDQTGPAGKGVYRLYVEPVVVFDQELYMSMVLDRASERIVLAMSASGGMEIEELAEQDPEAIVRVIIEPAVGLLAFQAREAAFACGLDTALISQAEQILLSAYRMFRDHDATLLEVNPLVVTEDRRLIALDAKMSFDDNALFRHQNISELRDKSQEDPREMSALDRGLNYVGLEGNIGCIINGAGLAMASMDMIKHAGGEPANFLDIGGGASPDRVAKAFRLVLSDDRVEAILVNIFAGINRCDWVAEGVVKAMTELEVGVPVVVRLAGTNVEEGRRILAESDVELTTAETLAEAGERAVASVSREALREG
ncbi:MAG: malate--CoA ligase subunit beta [Acidimicrobiales bacterium]|nr:malate--CoA ligase subunit beta [Acidimicrobiales bacterium]